MKKIFRRIATLSLAAALLAPGAVTAFAAGPAGSEQSATKYNVVFVVDESGSMNSTDPDQLRYDATELFLGLMTQSGNHVGTVSFDSGIKVSQDVMPVSGTEDKAVLSQALADGATTGGDTNIGAALDKAVAMLQTQGDASKPSVVILLTDGNTDLDNDPSVESKEETESLTQKSEAIEAARQSGIPVYSVCLNDNGSADVDETKQISEATGGEFREVTSAEDMSEVYQMFYSMIYGSQPIQLQLDAVPGSANFTVPEAGVEEANIMIEGKVNNVVYTAPDGSEYTDVESTECGAILVNKIVNPTPGEWEIFVDGEEGTSVNINLLYNYDYLVQDTSEIADSYNDGDTVSLTACLTDTNGTVFNLTQDGQYAAEVRFIDQNDEVIENVPMTLDNGGFAVDYVAKDQGTTYRYYIAVTLNDGDANSAICKRSEIREFSTGSNTAPVSNGDVSETIKLWPFKDAVYTLDMTTLASDAEDATLTYSVLSSSFLDKADYPDKGDYFVNGTVLTQDNFSLHKGSYIIRCTDSGGKFCDVAVTITAIPIGLMTVIGIIVVIAIIAAVVLFGIYQAMKTPFYGECYMKTSFDGEEEQRIKARGRITLGSFNMPLGGLDGKKSYLQAMRGEGVTLVTNKEVTVNGRTGKEHVIRSGGTGTMVTVGEHEEGKFWIRFVSLAEGGRRRGGRGGSRGGSRGTSGGGFGGGSSRGTDRGASRGTDRGASRGTDRGASRGTDRGASRGTDRGASRGTDRGASRGTDRGASRGTDRGSSRGTDRGSNRGTDRGASRGADRGSSRGSGRDRSFRR